MVKSEKTAQELARRLRDDDHVMALDYEAEAKELAAFLGVELAPEKPELPYWFGELEIIDDGSSEPVWNNKDTANAAQEGYNRFVRMKRRLEKYPETCGVVCEGHDAAVDALKIARGEEV